VEEPEDLSFEEALQQLGEVVQQLEAGDLPLEGSIVLFERGMHLAKLCESKLDEAEQRVSRIMGSEDGACILAPFAGQD
jgi:exodeoxyribonuclease VII small subunit